MILEKWLPRLRRHQASTMLGSMLITGLAILLRQYIPLETPFLTLYPAVLLSALIGGRLAGAASLTLSAVFAPFYVSPQGEWLVDYWEGVSLVVFVLVSIFMVYIIDQLDLSISRLLQDRDRIATQAETLRLAVRAADAGSWELKPPHQLTWDQSYYDLLGLDPKKHKPAFELFLSFVHPEDRQKLQAREAELIEGKILGPSHQYRFTRPDGTRIWLESHISELRMSERRIVGITQNITDRKIAEARISLLLNELSHRLKNQYAVILAMLRETAKTAQTQLDFVERVQARVAALSRSHDLLLRGSSQGVSISDLVQAQMACFESHDRVLHEGPRLQLTAQAAQYLGLALHELATNAAKYGALSSHEGKVLIKWSLTCLEHVIGGFQVEWRETGGPPVCNASAGGFGREVLTRLAPAALGGSAQLEMTATGIIWTLQGSVTCIEYPRDDPDARPLSQYYPTTLRWAPSAQTKSVRRPVKYLSCIYR
jgi:two-component sensor histidine kinase/PAS domain-containing protein